MQAQRAISRLVSKQVGWRYHSGGDIYKPTTLNDLPVPQGSWKTHYDANQRRYNGILALGVGSIVGVLVFGKAAGFLEFYNDIPERPADIASYKD